MTQSDTLFQAANKLIPGGVNSPVRAFRGVGGTPFFTKHAEGAYLTDVDNNTYIDYVCTWGPAIHGHNNKRIKDAISEALNHGTSFGTPSAAEVTMAERITSMVPSVQKVRMVNSGTEATMTSIRLARGYTGRDKIIKFSGCYHGHVDALLVAAGSGALTLGTPDSAGIPAAFAKETIVLPLNDNEALEQAFTDHKDSIAAVILEPYPANCGLILPREGYLKKLREICTKHKTVLIFDEVMTGFRVAAGGVQEREAITPDLTAMGKVIGGGLPVGAIGGKAEIMDHLAPLGPVYQAGTLSGNPLAMAAGITALDILAESSPYEVLDAHTQMIVNALTEAAKSKGLPMHIPHVPSMFCLFFTDKPVIDFDSAQTTQTKHFKSVFQYALNHGVYLPPSAFETCFISTQHNNDDIIKTCEVLSKAIQLI